MRGVSSVWHSIFCSLPLFLSDIAFSSRREEDERGIFSPSRSLGTERRRRLFLLFPLDAIRCPAEQTNQRWRKSADATYSRIRSRRTRPWPSPLPPLPPFFRLRPAQNWAAGGGGGRGGRGNAQNPVHRNKRGRESGRRGFFLPAQGH